MEKHRLPFVTVVVPCFNARHVLPECLDAIIHQTYPRERYEVLVVDNGSTDGTVELIVERYPRVTLLKCSEKGSGYARNKGILAASGEIIVSTDADCVSDPNWILALVSAFDGSEKNLAAIAGAILPYRTKTPVERFRRAWVSQPELNSKDCKIRYCATPNAAFKRPAICYVGCFDGSQGFDDTDLGIRLSAAGFTIKYCDAAIVRHRNPVTICDMFRHKKKYGQFDLRLSRKHPHLFGSVHTRRGHFLFALRTAKRIALDILVKLPAQIVSRRPIGPRMAPLLDAILASAFYSGYIKELRASRDRETPNQLEEIVDLSPFDQKH